MFPAIVTGCPFFFFLFSCFCFFLFLFYFKVDQGWPRSEDDRPVSERSVGRVHQQSCDLTLSPAACSLTLSHFG